MASNPPSTTPAQAAAAFVQYIADLNADRAAYKNWCAGTATGGPNGDGNYPLTDFTGNTILVACPAKIAAIGGNITAMMAGLAEANAAAVVPTQVETIFTPSTGATPVRGSPYLWTQSRTVDRSVLIGSEYAEWIDCLSSTGMERKIAFSALQLQFGGVIDPSRPPYNVKYDFKKTKPVSLTSGSNLVHSDEAVFSAADVGKLLCVSSGTSAGPLIGYVGAVTSTKDVRIFTDLTFATPSNAGYTTANQEAIWGTDCTAGMQAAFDAAEPGGLYEIGAVVVIGGICLATRLQFGSISVVGLADSGCGFASLPLNGSQLPFFCDKSGGAYPAYTTMKPDGYTIKNLTIYGQRFTNYYNSFRNAFEIRGGQFASFRRGAPYARVENIDVYEGQWNNIVTAGAYAGQFNSIRSFSAAQVGMRMGFWDLNGTNWHAEANGCCGIFSTMPGANVSTVRCAFNGASGGNAGNAGGSFPNEYGSNYVEAGNGNTISNLRMQESWSHNLCFTSTDPLGASNGGGAKCAFFIGTFDDTGDMVPGQGRDTTNLPGVRSMVYVKGNTCINNTINLVTGAGQVKTKNYATNAYWDAGNPSGNHVTITTPGITNDPSSWYAGGTISGDTTSTVATAPGPWGNSSSSSIATRGNVVSINGATAP